MYYCVRYCLNLNRPTEYYAGGGKWYPKNHDRCLIRFYESENIARLVIKDMPEAEVFYLRVIE